MVLGSPEIVVTGGCGFIGSELCRELVRTRGAGKVLVLDNLSSGRKENLPEGVFFVPLDLAKEPPLALARRLKGVGTIFHLASNVSVPRGGIDRFLDLRNNVEGTVRLLEACALLGEKKTIALASSSAVYGVLAGKKPKENSPCSPISMYGASKLACEGYLSAYCDNFGFFGATYRIANIVGKGQERGLLHDIFSQASSGEEVSLLGEGLEKKSYLHVSDCASGMVSGVLKGNLSSGKNEVFNLGSDNSISVGAVAAIARGTFLGRGPKISFSGKASWPGDVPEMVLNCSKLKKTGWSPKMGKSKDAVLCASRELSEKWLHK